MLLIDAWNIETTLYANGLIPPPTFDIKHVLPSREGLDCNHLHSAVSRSEFFETQLGEWMVLSHLCPNAFWDWKIVYRFTISLSLSPYIYISKNYWIVSGVGFVWIVFYVSCFGQDYTSLCFLRNMPGVFYLTRWATRKTQWSADICTGVCIYIYLMIYIYIHIHRLEVGYVQPLVSQTALVYNPFHGFSEPLENW